MVARTYNRLVETDPNQGTVGFAYNASLFFESADTTLVGFARDTKNAPTIAGKLRSNIGIRNTDINGTTKNCTVNITFYDTVTGNKVGNTITLADLRPGEVRQVSDIWATAQIPSTVNSLIVFADVLNPTLTSPTIEGYITVIEGFNTQDAAFFEMKCMDANGLRQPERSDNAHRRDSLSITVPRCRGACACPRIGFDRQLRRPGRRLPPSSARRP